MQIGSGPESATPIARTKLGPRGRVTVPVALQRAAGLAEGDEIVIRIVGPGAVTLESAQAVKDRIRAAAPTVPANAKPFDAVAEIRADRDAENAAIEAKEHAHAVLRPVNPVDTSVDGTLADPGPELLRRLL